MGQSRHRMITTLPALLSTLSDSEISEIYNAVKKRTLRPEGRVVTVDLVYTEDQLGRDQRLWLRDALKWGLDVGDLNKRVTHSRHTSAPPCIVGGLAPTSSTNPVVSVVLRRLANPNFKELISITEYLRDWVVMDH